MCRRQLILPQFAQKVWSVNVLQSYDCKEEVHPFRGRRNPTNHDTNHER